MTYGNLPTEEVYYSGDSIISHISNENKVLTLYFYNESSIVYRSIMILRSEEMFNDVINVLNNDEGFNYLRDSVWLYSEGLEYVAIKARFNTRDYFFDYTYLRDDIDSLFNSMGNQLNTTDIEVDNITNNEVEIKGNSTEEKVNNLTGWRYWLFILFGDTLSDLAIGLVFFLIIAVGYGIYFVVKSIANIFRN